MSTTGDLTPENTIQGGSDSTLIGNTGDKLKVSPDGSILHGLTFNKVTGTYPNSVTDVYKYYQDATLLSTVTVIYTSSAKKEIVSQERVDAV